MSVPATRSRAETAARVGLVVALGVVVLLAFRVSWGSLRDIALAIGADETAAVVFAFVVDGLMALALVATLMLDGHDRRFALWVLGGYTAASLVLNFVHGLLPELHGIAEGARVPLAPDPRAHYALVLLASSLPVASIFFGSDLVARILHTRPAATVPVNSTPAPAPSPAVPQPVAVDAAPSPGRRTICAPDGLLPVPEVPTRPRLSTEDAADVIANAWRDNLTVRHTAALATRSPAYVHRRFKELEAESSAGQVPGQLALAKEAS